MRIRTIKATPCQVIVCLKISNAFLLRSPQVGCWVKVNLSSTCTVLIQITTRRYVGGWWCATRIPPTFVHPLYLVEFSGYLLVLDIRTPSARLLAGGAATYLGVDSSDHEDELPFWIREFLVVRRGDRGDESLFTNATYMSSTG